MALISFAVWGYASWSTMGLTFPSDLFPQDVVANAPRIISDLKAIFPPQDGIFLIGPMAKIGWGTPTLISLSLGVIIEIPPSDVAILGIGDQGDPLLPKACGKRPDVGGQKDSGFKMIDDVRDEQSVGLEEGPQHLRKFFGRQMIRNGEVVVGIPEDKVINPFFLEVHERPPGIVVEGSDPRLPGKPEMLVGNLG